MERLRTPLLRLVRVVARFGPVARLALRLRDGANIVLRDGLNDGLDPERNGEAAVVRALAPGSASFVDVGANVGDWSELFCALAPEGVRGLLVEPGEVAARRLEVRFAGRDGVAVVHAAASDSAGRATFFEGADASESSSLIASSHRGDVPAHEVELTTVDALLGGFPDGRCDFLKIDAEGHDLHVLRGAAAGLGEQRIGAVQFEYHKLWAASASTLGAAVSLLGSSGYELFRVRARGLEPVEYEPYRDYFGYSNYLAVAASRRAEVGALIA